MKKDCLGIIGAGQMGEALIKGLLASGKFSSSQILAGEPEAARRQQLAQVYGIKIFAENNPLLEQAATIILAVKPQVVDTVLEEERLRFSPEHLLISIAAGVPLARLIKPFSRPPRTIRVMPNACAMVGEGAAVICPGAGAREEDEQAALTIFNCLGRAFIIREERLLDAVTALSGSGPAYFFLFMEALCEGAVTQGLSWKLARELVVQTASGAARMAQQSGLHLAQLKEMITSPGGTTAAALKKLEQAGIRGVLMEAVEAATRRARELGQG